jgi:ATP-dependent DNA helicase RecQ
MPREDDKTINRISRIIDQQNKLKHDQVNAVINYINNDNVCKNVQLLSYFGEDNLSNCGICSVCVSGDPQRSKNQIKDDIEILINAIKKESLSSRAIAQLLDLSQNEVTALLKDMLERELIKVTETNTYTLK